MRTHQATKESRVVEVLIRRMSTSNAIRDAEQAFSVANAAAVPGKVLVPEELKLLWASHEALRDEVNALRAMLWGDEQ